MKTTAMTYRTAGRGFSLIEMMVALVLGSLVIAAATRLFLTNQQAFALQQSQAEAQEAGRFALEYMLGDIRRLGTKADAYVDSTLAFPAALGLPWNNAQNDVTTGGRGGMDGGGTDRLVVFYYDTDSPNPVDCEGNSVLAGAPPRLVINTYYLDDYSDATGGKLYCDGNGDGNATGTEIVSGVDSFQVLYGVSSAVDKPKQYVTSNNIAGRNVLAVRVALLMRSSNRIEGIVPGSTYQVLDKAVASTDPADDLRLRRLFVGTAFIRNPY